MQTCKIQYRIAQYKRCYRCFHSITLHRVTTDCVVLRGVTFRSIPARLPLLLHSMSLWCSTQHIGTPNNTSHHIGQHRRFLAGYRPMLAQCSPNLAGMVAPALAKTWTELDQCWPRLVKSGQTWQTSTQICRSWPGDVWSRSKHNE